MTGTGASEGRLERRDTTWAEGGLVQAEYLGP